MSLINENYFTNFKNPETGKVRVFMVQANLFASGYYRIGFIAEELAKRGNIEVDYLSDNSNAEDLMWRIGKADVVVMQLQTQNLASNLIDICKCNGIPIVMDMDDNLLDVPDWNPAYIGLGRRYSPLWKDMNVKENKQRLRNIKYNLRTVDLITVTGDGLRNEYSKFNKVKILPNLVDPKRIYTSRRSGGFFDKKIRIFWQGSATHMKDLLSIKPAVQFITEKYPQVQWFIWGSGYKDFATFMGIPENRVETKKTVSMDDYYKNLYKIKMDIGICPLLDIPYNRCKSNIKWLEYSLCGIPTVASNVSIYQSIHHGRTGFLVNNVDEWIAYLEDLIDSKPLRNLIAEQAKVQILRDFNIQTKIDLWEETFIKLHNNNPNKI